MKSFQNFGMLRCTFNFHSMKFFVYFILSLSQTTTTITINEWNELFFFKEEKKRSCISSIEFLLFPQIFIQESFQKALESFLA